MYFAVLRQPGPAWDGSRSMRGQRDWDAHATFMDDLAAEGFIVLGGPLGDGRQWMSWIHIDDAVGLLLHAVRTEAVTGPLDVTAPTPVTNLEFARALGKVLGRPASIPTPTAVLRMALGEFAQSLVTGQRVLPRKAEASGYRFRFPQLEGALRDALAQ